MNKLQNIGNQGLKFIFIAISIFILGLIGMQIAQSYLGGTAPQAVGAQLTYDSAILVQEATQEAEDKAITANNLAKSNVETALCGLSMAKLNDVFAGFEEASQERIDELKSKCDFQ